MTMNKPDTAVRLEIEDRPKHSPHRIFLRGIMTANFRGWEPGFTVYYIQEAKTGARRGQSPAWRGYFERQQENTLREIERRYNGFPRLVEALRDMLAADELVRANKKIEQAWGAAYDLLHELEEV